MSAATTTTSAALAQSNGQPPRAILDALASRFRAAGLCVLLVSPEGNVLWHDLQAPAFFGRYAMPLLRHPAYLPAVAEAAGHGNCKTAPAVWQVVPAVAMAAVPFADRRCNHGLVVVAGKCERFSSGEDVIRACGQARIDTKWLATQAQALPGWGEESIRRQGELLQAMLRDQLKLQSLQGELDSISGQLANTYEELSLIYQISGGIKVNRPAQEFFRQACLDVLEVIGARGVGVALSGDNARRQEPVLYGPLTIPASDVRRLAAQMIECLSDRKTPLVVDDISKDKSLEWLAPHARQLLAVPLMREEKVLGCLFGLDKVDSEFDSSDAKLLHSIANESAIFIENAALFEDVHGLMMGLLHSLTSAVDAKDAYTCGHSERVAMLAKALAHQAGLTAAQVERIYMAGLLHDVGKIGVPESVLQKTGRLTVEEFEQMKKHPLIGARILQNVKQSEDVIPGVLHHHEKYDGSGYPHGLSGENIPLMGRIICLADSFDAMTSNRTYRNALPLEVALSEIRKCAGTHFDPKLAEAFVAIGVDRFRQMLRAYQDGAAASPTLRPSDLLISTPGSPLGK